jgi:poly(3-hydroxybutyrate) depolymerase
MVRLLAIVAMLLVAMSGAAEAKTVKPAKQAKAKAYDLKAAVRSYFQAPDGRRDAIAADIASHANAVQVVKTIASLEPVLAAKVKGDHETRQVAGGSYVVVLPNGYTHRRAWPLHIALHGKGESQSASTMCDRYWNGDAAAAGFVLACPDHPGGDWKTPSGEALVLSTYRDVLARYNIKANQVSLGGFSAGAIGTWHIGAKYPDLFAALVPRAGVGPSTDDDLIANFKSMPVWACHGRDDRNIPITRPGATRSMVLALRKAKCFTRSSIYKEFANVAHDFRSDLNRSVLRWLAGKKRATPREAKTVEAVLLPDRSEKTAWFVEVESDVRQRLRATVGADNDVSIEIGSPAHARRLTVYVNKHVADVGKAVTVRVNGRSFVIAPRDDVALALSTYAQSRDVRRTFVARHSISRDQIAGLPPSLALATDPATR